MLARIVCPRICSPLECGRCLDESLGVARQLEDAEDADQPDDPQHGERHGAVAGRPAVLGDRRAEREEVRRDGDDVDEVHGVAKEQNVVGRRGEPNEEFDGEPDDADRLDDEKRFGEQRHIVVVVAEVVVVVVVVVRVFVVVVVTVVVVYRRRDRHCCRRCRRCRCLCRILLCVVVTSFVLLSLS